MSEWPKESGCKPDARRASKVRILLPPPFIGLIYFLFMAIGNVRGSNSVGRVSAFQAECREFEPRLPLFPNHSNLPRVRAYIAQW